MATTNDQQLSLTHRPPTRKQPRGVKKKIGAARALYEAHTGNDLPMELLETREIRDALYPYFVKMALPEALIKKITSRQIYYYKQGK